MLPLLALGALGLGTGAAGISAYGLGNKYANSENLTHFLTGISGNQLSPGEQANIARGGVAPQVTQQQQAALEQLGKQGLLSSAWGGIKNSFMDTVSAPFSYAGNYLMDQLGIPNTQQMGQNQQALPEGQMLPGVMEQGFNPQMYLARTMQDLGVERSMGRTPSLGKLGAAYGSQYGPQAAVLMQLLGQQAGNTFGQTQSRGQYPGNYYQPMNRNINPMTGQTRLY